MHDCTTPVGRMFAARGQDGYRTLRAYPSHATFWSHRQHSVQFGYQGSKIFQAIRKWLENNHGNGELRKVLLKG